MKTLSNNRVSSRALAVIMAVLLAMSSLTVAFVMPSISASAATGDNLVARYFVNDSNTNEVGSANLINNGTDVRWSTNENAAHFNSDNNKQNYLKVKFSDLLPNATYVKGMTFSFMAKDSSRENSWQRYFEITCANPYSGESKSYLYAAVNGGVRIKNTSFSNDETNNISYGNSDGNWHKFTIVIQNDYITVYRDGVEKGYTSNINIINEGLYNQFIDSAYFVFGASTYNDPAYEGYLKDFRIYDAALTQSEIQNEDSFLTADANDLQNAISTYETKMNNSNEVFKNYKPAYDAYIVANRYLDAINYGGAVVDTNKLLKIKNTLVSATNNLKPWSRTTFSTVYPSFAADNAHEYTYRYDNVCKNLLWVSNVTYDDYTLWGEEQGVYTGSNKNTVQPAIFRPSAIMVYDGTDPSMPVMFLERLWKGGAFGGQLNMWTFYAGINDNQGMYLNEKWHGTDGQLNFLYCYNHNNATGLNYTVGNTSTFDKISRNNSKGEHKYYYANKMLFNGGSFASDEYYRVVKNILWSMHFTNNDDPLYDNGDSHAKTFNGTEGDKKGIQGNEVENPIYIINYKAVIDEMEKYKASSLNVRNYKEGGLSELLGKVDALAEFDMLKEYTFDGNSFDNVEKCGNRIGKLVSDVRAQSASHKVIYDTLRQEMNRYKVYYNNANLKNYYSSASVDVFINAYDSAKVKMAMLVDNDYDTNEQEIKQLAENIGTTYNNLERLFVLNFVGIDGDTIGTVRVEKDTPAENIIALAPALPESGIEGDYLVIYSWDKEITTATSNATYTVTRTQTYDVSAYNTAVALANECIADTNKYSQEDRNILQSVLDNNKVTAESTLDDINAYTTAITTAITNLSYRRCNIQFIYQIDNEVSSSRNMSYRYGETVTLVGPQNAIAYKWTYSIDDKDYVIANGTDSVEYTVSGDMIIDVYATSQKSIQNASKTRVILLDNADRVVSVCYASIGSEITFRDTIFSVDGVNVMSKRIPFYTAKGFIVDGNTYAMGSTYTVNGTDDIIVHSIYNA